MMFNFLVFINLVLVTTVSSSSLSFNSYLRQRLPDNCTPLLEETIKHFDSCQVANRSPIIRFGADALPYLCLLSLDLGTEVCQNAKFLRKLHQPRMPKPACPMGYALETSNLNVSIEIGLTYMANEENCKGICHFNQNVLNICNFIALANDIITEVKNTEISLDRVKGADNQSVHLLAKEKTDSVIGEGGITEDTKLAQETKPEVSPKQLHEIILTLTNNKTDFNEPVTKAEGIIVNKTTDTADLHLKPNLEGQRPDGSIYKNNSFTAMNDSNSSNVSVNKSVFENGISKNDDNYKIKPMEINKSQDLASNKGNADIAGTELPPSPSPSPSPSPLQLPSENDYGLKNQQNNFNVMHNNNNNNQKNNKNNNNNNGNSNNNNMEFEDDLPVKAPHEEGNNDNDNNNEDMDKSAMQDTVIGEEPQFAKSVNQKDYYKDNFFQAEDSHFSVYFLTCVSLILIGYVIYHNKNKILAYALEGRRNKNGRRRPTSASYRKLDCNLEEAITSNPSHTSVTNVVY